MNNFKFEKKTLTSPQFRKVSALKIKEDLNEIKDVSEGVTVDKIKTLKHINRSHSNLLDEIKSVKPKLVDTTQLDDTMKLFDNESDSSTIQQENISDSSIIKEDLELNKHIPSNIKDSMEYIENHLPKSV